VRNTRTGKKVYYCIRKLGGGQGALAEIVGCEGETRGQFKAGKDGVVPDNGGSLRKRWRK